MRIVVTHYGGPDSMQVVETGMVSPGFDRTVGHPSTAKDQAADRAAISPGRGKASARVAREGRRDRQDRAPAQRDIAGIRSHLIGVLVLFVLSRRRKIDWLSEPDLNLRESRNLESRGGQR